MKTDVEIENAIETYADTVRKICFLHLKQHADVEDVFQEVFLKYARSDKEFNDAEHEKAWLIRVTMNACKDTLTSWFRKKVVLSDDISYFEMEEKKDDLLDVIVKLPKKYKNVLYLFYYEGYKVNEMALLLQINENTLHTWLRRAREALKLELGGDDLEETNTFIS